MTVAIEQVSTRGDRRRFLNLPWHLYYGDPAWVAPLRIELARRIDPAKNPFFRHGAAELFLARNGREVVGRISAQVDSVASRQSSVFCSEVPRFRGSDVNTGTPEHRTSNNEGAFGFYECVDDPEVSRALLSAASDWLAKQGVTKIVGPYNFRLEDPAPGFLTKGFDLKPTFMMAYSKPYYPSQLEAAGFTTAMDLHSYSVDREHSLPQGLLDRAAQAASIPGIRVRQLEMSRLYEEAELLRQIFNESLKDNWGFVSFTASQARQMARDLKMLADPRIVLIAEVSGSKVSDRKVSDLSRTPFCPIGAVINLPNFNDIFADCNGRLFPKGLYRMWRCRDRIKGLRGYAMAVLPEYQGHGVGCLLICESYANGMAAGYTYGEITWILGSNKGMNELTQYLGGQQQKGYRLYEMALK